MRSSEVIYLNLAQRAIVSEIRSENGVRYDSYKNGDLIISCSDPKQAIAAVNSKGLV